ncbi:MAG: hypothetical protein J4F46_09130, partial [Dehalococcoidia bacterium]|nr:hypothetical protein [Dehalococcoidia bacterium]
MAEEINISRDISPRPRLHDATGDPLFLPRLAGALLVIAGLVIGIDTAVFDAFLPLDFALLSISRAQTFLIPDGFWGFLSGSILPTGLGALLLVKAEGMRSAKLSDKAIMYGRAAGIAVAVAGLV